MQKQRHLQSYLRMRKWLPKLVAPLPIFWKFNPPCLEIGDGTKLWECFGNHLIHFLIWFWNSFIKYFNPGISFVVFSLHISKGEINIFLDSKCIDIVTKFLYISIVFFFNGYLFLAFYIWVILKGTTSLTWCKSLRCNYFYPQGWIPQPGRAPVGVWTGNLPILILTSKPTRPLSPSCLWIPKCSFTDSQPPI